MAERFDIIIVGGGMVGGLLGAALAEQGVSVCVLESAEPAAFEPGSMPVYDLRVSALSLASRRMLENVGAWQGVLARRACPYRELMVWDGEAGGRTTFNAAECGESELGYIVENRVVQLALLERLQAASNVSVRCPAILAQVRPDVDGIRVALTDGTELQGGLLVGADGAGSRVRDQSGIGIDRERYAQHALVATIETVSQQQSMTWQRFVPTGPQALLPLCGSFASMVWYHDEEEVNRLRSLEDDEFVAELESTFPEELGGVVRVLNRGSFPIAKAHASRYVADRTAIVGDAAHTVHPLAGQGVNLGLLDAAALADCVTNALARQQDIGSARVLRRYERQRRGENALMIHALDAIHRAFTPQAAPVRSIRSLAMRLADRAGPAKRLVMRHALGLDGEIPPLAQRAVTDPG